MSLCRSSPAIIPLSVTYPAPAVGQYTKSDSGRLSRAACGTKDAKNAATPPAMLNVKSWIAMNLRCSRKSMRPSRWNTDHVITAEVVLATNKS